MGVTETTIGVAARQMPLPAASLVSGRYRVETLIGGGGCGLVYAGRHEVVGKPIAIKIMRPELARDSAQAQRFFREARLAAGLQHENIVDISDFGTDESTKAPYLVMELLRGRTLMAAMRDVGVVPWPRTVSILLQMTRALAYAHQQGVLHRDLKPHNVMLTEASAGGSAGAERVKLCDFGLTRLRAGDEGMTGAGNLVGTPTYMSPEQIAGDEQDERCDLYALGVTAFEMLTGSSPYRATTAVSLVTEILTGGRVSLRDRVDTEVPERLVSLIDRLIARDRNERPSSATAVERELLAIADNATLPQSDLAGSVVGSYKVTTLLGSGSSGSVWLAEHPLIGTKVAIKVLRPEIAALPDVAERFVNEARAANSIPSPHVAHYLDLGRLPSQQPYAMIEFLDGETVAKRLARTVRLSIAETLELGGQIASALDAAHGLGIVHRDIKPENLFITSAGVKILDFGIAKVTSPSGDSAMKTQMGLFMGTIMYSPPEQLIGSEIGPAADVYALGASMFEMLAGQPPFTGDAAEISSAKAGQEAPPINDVRADVPTCLATLIADMLSRNPTRRPTMANVVDRLTSRARSDENDETENTTAPRETVSVSLRRRHYRWLVALAVVATLAMGGVLGALTVFASTPDQPTIRTPAGSVAPTPSPSAAAVAAPTPSSAAPPPVLVVSPAAPPAVVAAPKPTKHNPIPTKKPALHRDPIPEAAEPDVIIIDPFAGATR
jgi:eukaryotic-like serine/threonine-protein kinase